MKKLTWGEEGGEPTLEDIPAEEKEKAEAMHKALVEAAAENDEGLMEKFFETEHLTECAPNHACHVNEHLGFIKFGSRVDLFLPEGSKIFVDLGEKTRGNETIIARLPE